MEPELWRKVDLVYHAALEIESIQRTDFIKQSCTGDEVLEQEVRSLLAQAEARDSFLEAPAVEVAAQSLATEGPAVSPAGSTIGRYRVVRLLGEGGMGAVYEAEQDQPRRTVALKVIKPGFATTETLRRFQDESEALGRLQHSGIAQIYEASTADTGFGPQPYFAMELIRGLPLHEYAEQHKLTTHDRLALLAKVCDAVDHAHQRGVIHRDLKPGNILVDETGQPKILDFGVARVTDSEVQHTRQTDLGQLVGTLAYMSPEQVAGDPSALDTRSDVYALGVTLYELLAGKLPYDISRKPLPEAVASIREQEPSPPSSIHRTYRGDIDTIVAKALEKDKARRYASAAEFAGDIRRYLADEPITARPASATYQLQKFARRHKALLAGTAAVFVVLAAGVMASTWEAVRARTAEATAEAVNDFLRNDLLTQASARNQAGPGSKPDPHLEVRTALDRAAARIAGKFDKQPEVEAAIRFTIGQTYFDLELCSDAGPQFRRALELQRRVLGEANPKTLNTMHYLAVCLDGPSTDVEADALMNRTLRIRRNVLGPEHPDTLSSLRGLAGIYMHEGKGAQAEALDRDALDISRRILGPEHPDTLAAMANLSFMYRRESKYAEAEVLLSQLLVFRRRKSGPEHPDTLKAMDMLAVIYNEQGRYSEAEALHEPALEVKRRVLGPEQFDTLRTMNNLGNDYLSLGKYGQAQALFSQVVEICRRVQGPESDGTIMFTNNLAQAYAAQGMYAQAEELVAEAIHTARRVMGPEHGFTLMQLSTAASIYQLQGKHAIAEAYARQVVAGSEHAFGADDVRTAQAAEGLALVYVSRGKFAESEPIAREALENQRKKRPDDWQRYSAESLLGASLAGQKKYTEAEPLLLAGYQGMLKRKYKIGAPDRYHLDRAHDWLVHLYQAWGKPEKAADWKKRTD